jgi:hypothetical protein
VALRSRLLSVGFRARLLRLGGALVVRELTARLRRDPARGRSERSDGRPPAPL